MIVLQCKRVYCLSLTYVLVMSYSSVRQLESILRSSIPGMVYDALGISMRFSSFVAIGISASP